MDMVQMGEDNQDTSSLDLMDNRGVWDRETWKKNHEEMDHANTLKIEVFEWIQSTKVGLIEWLLLLLLLMVYFLNLYLLIEKKKEDSSELKQIVKSRIKKNKGLKIRSQMTK